MSEITQKLAKNTLLQIVGKGLGTILSLITFVLLVRYLDTDGFGALTVALNYGAIFAILVDFGLTLTTAQMIAEPKADENRILGGVLTLRIVSAFLFLSIGAILVLTFPYSLEIKIAAMLSCVAFFFGSVASMFAGVFQKRLALRNAVVAETMNRIAVVLLVALLPVLGVSIVFASGIFVVGSIVQLLITLVAVLKFANITPTFDFAIWKIALIRSWPIGLSTALNLVYLKGDVFFMSLLGISDHDIGLYGAAYKVVDVVTTIPVMFMGLMLPLLTHAWVGIDRASFREHLQRAFDGLALLGVPFAFGAVAVGTPLMILLDSDLAEAGIILAILGPATTIVFFGSLFGHTIVAINKQRPMIWGYFITAVLSTIAYIIGITNYGMLAAAWVTLGSEMLIMTLTAVVVLATTKTRLSLRLLGSSLLASLVMYGVIVLLPLPHVLLTIAFGITVYGLVLPIFGGPSPRRLVRLVLPKSV